MICLIFIIAIVLISNILYLKHFKDNYFKEKNDMQYFFKKIMKVDKLTEKDVYNIIDEDLFE